MTTRQNLQFLTAIFSLLIAVSSQVSAQGDYLSKGQAGIEISAGYATSDLANTYFVNFGHTSNGSTDFHFSIGQVTENRAEYVALSPSVVFYPIKQQKNALPFSLALSIGFEMHKITSSSSSSWVTLVQGGAALFFKNRLSERVSIQPEVAYLFASGTDYNYKTNGIGLSMSIFICHSTNRVIRLKPAVTIIDGNNSFSITLGMIFQKAMN